MSQKHTFMIVMAAVMVVLWGVMMVFVGAAAASDGPDLDAEWDFDTDEPVSADVDTDDADETVFAGDEGGTIYAIDEATGTEEWQTNVGVRVEQATHYESGMVVADTNADDVYAFDASDGSQEWSVSFSETIIDTTVAQGTVFVNTVDEMVALDVQNGSELWRVNAGADAGFEVQDVVVESEGLLISKANNLVTAMDISNGAIEWTSNQNPGKTLETDGERVFVGSADEAGSLTALDAANGELVWENIYDGRSGFQGVGANENGDIFAGIPTNIYDGATGDEQVEIPTDVLRAGPTLDDRYAYFGTTDFDDAFRVVDLETGGFVGIEQTQTGVLSAPVVTEDAVFVGFLDESVSKYEIDAFEPTPELSNIYPDGEDVSDGAIELRTEVEYELFDENDVSVTFILNDDEIGTQTVSERSTVRQVASDELEAGENEFRIEAESESGTTAVGEVRFRMPSTIELRDELTEEKLDTNEFEVTLTDQEERVETQTVTDGEIELQGLDAGQQYVVDVNEEDGDDYFDQSFVVQNIWDTDNLYLLDQSETELETEFLVDDNTGQFDSASTRLIVEKYFESEDDWEQVSGGEIGANREYIALLHEGDRYRLIVDDGDGTTRNRGSYIADRERVTEIRIDDLEWQIDDGDDGIRFDLRQEGDENDTTLQFQLEDADGLLSEINLKIYPRGQSDEPLVESTFPVGDELTLTEPVPEDQQNVSSWTVEWEDSTGEFSGQTVAGPGDYGIGLPGPVGLFSALFITFIAGMFSVRAATLGAVIVPVVATAFWAIGWLPVPLTWVLAALTLGVGAGFAKSGGLQSR